MTKPVNALLAVLGRHGKDAQPGQGRDAAKGLADAFATLVEKPPRMSAVKTEKTKDAPAISIKPEKTTNGQQPASTLSSELVFAAALPRTEQAEPARAAKPSRKPVKTADEPSKVQASTAPALEAVMLAARALTGDAPKSAQVIDPEEPLDLPPDPPLLDLHPVENELPAKHEEANPSPLPAVVFAKAETHFDTARITWAMTGTGLPVIAPEGDPLPSQRVAPPVLHLNPVPANEPLKSLTLEIDPGVKGDAVTATLKLRQDQLEVRLETGDGDMAMRLKDAASVLTQSLEQGGYRVETVVVQKAGFSENAPALMQAAANQDRSGRSRTRSGREGRMGDERTAGPRRARAGDIIV